MQGRLHSQTVRQWEEFARFSDTCSTCSRGICLVPLWPVALEGSVATSRVVGLWDCLPGAIMRVQLADSTLCHTVCHR